MEILLIAAIAVVAVGALYVAATFDLRARQSTAPLLEEAVRKMSDQLRATEESMRRQLRALADDLQRDREQQRLDGRKIQGRLDHADSRIASVANQFLADLDAIKRATAPRPAGPAPAVSGPQPPAQAPEPSPGDQAPEIAAAPVPAWPSTAWPTRPVTVWEPLPQPRSPEPESPEPEPQQAESPEPEPPDRPAHPGWPGLGPR